jgi:hypothetical protein
MKKMQKKHMEELINRELREMRIVCSFCMCTGVSCVALIIRE